MASLRSFSVIWLFFSSLAVGSFAARMPRRRCSMVMNSSLSSVAASWAFWSALLVLGERNCWPPLTLGRSLICLVSCLVSWSGFMFRPARMLEGF